MKKTNILSTLLAIFCFCILKAQDTRVAQSYANPLRINPAIMGINTDLKFVFNYRSQWASIGNGYKTLSFTGMCPVFINSGKSKLDIGVSAFEDKAGAFSTFDGVISLDYNLEIAKNNFLTVALLAGMVQKSLNLNGQTFDHQYVNGSYDASNAIQESFSKSETHPDVGFGFMWFLNPDRKTSPLNAFAGLSAYHLNKPNETLLAGNAALPVKYGCQAGVKIFGANKIDFSPNFRMTMQAGNSEVALGTYMDYNFTENSKLVLGAWYRMHDAFAVLLGFEHKNFTIGYSYDMINTTLSKVAPVVNAHELTLSLKFSRLSKAKGASFGADEKGNSAPPSVRTSPLSSF